jgi:hypothetical protein
MNDPNFSRSQITVPALIGAFFLVIAIGGSTSHHMNRTADEHGMSAGRPGDAPPNRINDQDTNVASIPTLPSHARVEASNRPALDS